MIPESKYKTEIAKVLGTDPASIFLYWKGRTALYAILKAMEVGEGDEVILPGFTCVVVPNAILYTGAKPVYVDISTENYNMDVNKLEGAITNRTKVIICQNTFGLSSNVDKIHNIAKNRNLYTIEDCTHGFGGSYKGKPNGSYCDAAFYSTQWNKPFSTGIGGFLSVNNPLLTNRIKSLEDEKVDTKLTDSITLWLLIFFRKYFITNFTQTSLVKLFRFMSKYNLIIGSNQGEELSDIKMPEDYFKSISLVQVKTGLKQLKKLNKINQLRKKNAMDYTRFLKEHNKTYTAEELFSDHLFLKYPLLVKDKDRFFESAKEYRVVPGDWFLSPLHPIEEDLSQWEFDENNFPHAVYISKHIVNLPTDIKNNTHVLKFLSEDLDQII